MDIKKDRVSKAFAHALRLPLQADSRYVLFSDCHRGVGNANDNFLKNEYLYLAALQFYDRLSFTYLELGDGDELWENRSIQRIQEMHSESFSLLKRLRSEGRMYALYGNHDIENARAGFHEAIILQDEKHRRDIYLTHGHQVDWLNSTLWRLSRFLVRYVWSVLEKLGIPDPTSAAKNNKRKKISELRLTSWAKTHHCILVTGHTHHPMIGTKASPYCNTGSCIHPSGITCIEIENRCLTLVKWSMQADEKLSLHVVRTVLGKTVCIDEFF